MRALRQWVGFVCSNTIQTQNVSQQEKEKEEGDLMESCNFKTMQLVEALS